MEYNGNLLEHLLLFLAPPPPNLSPSHLRFLAVFHICSCRKIFVCVCVWGGFFVYSTFSCFSILGCFLVSCYILHKRFFGRLIAFHFFLEPEAETCSYRYRWVAINLEEKSRSTLTCIKTCSERVLVTNSPKQHIHILWNRKRAPFTQALSCNALN